MSHQELRDAAERLRKVEDNFSKCRSCPISSVYKPDPIEPSIASWQEDQRIVVQAWLSEHAADDEELATQEWLMERGFAEIGYYTYERILHLALVKVYAYARPVGCWEISLFVAEHHVKNNPTRGDVRRLLAALGIQENKE